MFFTWYSLPSELACRRLTATSYPANPHFELTTTSAEEIRLVPYFAELFLKGSDNQAWLNLNLLYLG